MVRYQSGVSWKMHKLLYKVEKIFTELASIVDNQFCRLHIAYDWFTDNLWNRYKFVKAIGWIIIYIVFFTVFILFLKFCYYLGFNFIG